MIDHPGGDPDDMVVLAAHIAAVWFLVGLIWVVQLVIYPGFEATGTGLAAPEWARHHERHSRTMSWVVFPPWVLQGATCVLLLIDRPAGVPFWLAAAAGVTGLITVAATVALSVPCHRRLTERFDAGAARRLVRTNWWRTAAWTAAGGLALAMLGAHLTVRFIGF